MDLLKRIIRKSLKVTDRKGHPRRVYFGPLKGYRWVYNSGYSGYWMGSYELDIATRYISEVRSSQTIYDLGAHIGYYTLMAARFVGKGGRVYAFEPFPQNYKKLSSHIEMNKLDNIIAIQKAVGSKNGKIQFSNSPNDSANTYIVDSYMYKTFDHIEVDSVTLDSIIADEGMSPPNLLKIDVEGAELDVLKGAERSLRTFHPTIFLSTHNCQNEGIHKKCLDYLSSLGYVFEYFNHHKKITEFDDPWYDLIAKSKMDQESEDQG